jgi:hypothetical protein
VDKNRRLYSNSEIASFHTSGRKIFGEAGANTSTGLDVNNQKGNYGEQIIGNMLNLIACETEDFYVFHSIGLPLTLAGETDHVVVYKNKIILIETKAYSGYRSLKVNSAGVLRGWKKPTRKPLKVEDNHIFEKINVYQKRFDNRKVQAAIAIVRDDVETSSQTSTYQVVSIDNFFKFLREEIETAAEIKEDAWPAIKFFSMLCIKKHVKMPAAPISPA